MAGLALNSAMTLSMPPRGGGGGGAPPVEVGGVAIGAEGGAGTPASGMRLSDGDDFNGASADFITPTSHLATIATTRHYGAQSSSPKLMRGAGSLAGYDIDPWHPGDNFNGRTAAPASFADSIKIEGGALKLKSRRVLAGEQALFGDLSAKGAVSSMVHFARRLQLKAPFYFEVRIRFPHALASWGVFHPCIWFLDSLPSNGADGNEIDIEGYNNDLSILHGQWTNWSVAFAPLAGKTAPIGKVDYSTIGIAVTETQFQVYQDGVAKGTPISADFASRPLHLVLTNHILQSGYVQGDWDAAGDAGAEFHIDYWRVWTPLGAAARAPITSGQIYQVPFDTNFSINLPSAASIFGGGVSSYVLEHVPNEANAPGKGSGSTWWRGLLPTGVTRTGDVLAGRITDRPGRMIMGAVALAAAGETCRPYPITVCVGPNLTTPSITYDVGVAGSFDLFAEADCGDLSIGKTVSVTGLPAWASYDSGTGLVTWSSPTDVGTINATVTITNGIGQTATETLAFSKSVAVPTYFFEDTFAGGAGALSGRSADTGGVWATQLGTSHSVTASGTIYQADAGTGFMTNAQAVPSANYFVEADMLVRSVISGSSISINGRMNASFQTFYGIRYTAGSYIVYKSSSGTLTTLGTYAETPGVGTTTTIRLDIEDNGLGGVVLTGYVNGVVRVGPITDSSSPILPSGRVGTRIFGNTSSATTGYHFEAMRAGSL